MSCRKSGQDPVGFQEAIDLQGLFQVEGKARELLGAHHLAGGLEAEDGGHRAGKVRGRQSKPQPLRSLGQEVNEVLDEYSPEAIVVIEFFTKLSQHCLIQKGQASGIGLMKRTMSLKIQTHNQPLRVNTPTNVPPGLSMDVTPAGKVLARVGGTRLLKLLGGCIPLPPAQIPSQCLLRVVR